MGFINTYINGCLAPNNSFNYPVNNCFNQTATESSSTNSNENTELVDAITSLSSELTTLKSDLAKIQNLYVSSTPVLALLDYTYGFQKKDGSDIYAGNIHFQEVTITTDPDKNRLWHFRWGGEIVADKFNTVFEFNPETTLPIGDENVTITKINFNSAFYDGEQEYIQGHITVNNVSIGISYLKKVADFEWDAANATFTLKFNLTNWNPNWKTLLNWVDVPKNFDPTTYKDQSSKLLAPNGANSIHAEFSIRDAVSVVPVTVSGGTTTLTSGYLYHFYNTTTATSGTFYVLVFSTNTTYTYFTYGGGGGGNNQITSSSSFTGNVSGGSGGSYSSSTTSTFTAKAGTTITITTGAGGSAGSAGGATSISYTNTSGSTTTVGASNGGAAGGTYTSTSTSVTPANFSLGTQYTSWSTTYYICQSGAYVSRSSVVGGYSVSGQAYSSSSTRGTYGTSTTLSGNGTFGSGGGSGYSTVGGKGGNGGCFLYTGTLST
jgi:hypothetical protein